MTTALAQSRILWSPGLLARPVLLTAVEAERGLVVGLLVVIPFSDDGVFALALGAIANRGVRSKGFEPGRVDIVGHRVEVVHAAEKGLVLAEHLEPLSRRRPTRVPVAVAVEGVPEQALDLEGQVAPHVLPITTWLILVGLAMELEREFPFLDELGNVAVGPSSGVWELAGD